MGIGWQNKKRQDRKLIRKGRGKNKDKNKSKRK